MEIKVKNKKRRIWWIIVLAVLAVSIVLCALMGNFLYNFALRRADAVKRSPGEAVWEDYNAEYERLPEVFVPDDEWAKSVGRTETYMDSYDGLKLHGYFIPAPGTNKYVIICHGYHSKANDMLGFAERFYRLGYGALLPDARGHGESGGDYVGMGWHERLDVVAWAERLAEEQPGCQIVLFGVSMGGATVMMASGEALPDNVKAVVEDCGYSSVREEFAYNLKQMFHLPEFPMLNIASMFARIRAGYDLLKDGNAAEQVAKSQTPTLFIHGGNDTFVPTDMVYTVYEAANCEKELLVVEGAIHGMASGRDPALYWATVEAFLAKYVGQGGPA